MALREEEQFDWALGLNTLTSIKMQFDCSRSLPLTDPKPLQQHSTEKHENEKKRVYGQRIREVKRGVLTCFVLMWWYVMRVHKLLYKRLALMTPSPSSPM